MDQWFFASPGQQPRGPVQLDELKRMVTGGQVRQQDVAWRAGMPAWLPVAQIPELAGAGAPRSAAPRPGAAAPKPGVPAGAVKPGTKPAPRPIPRGAPAGGPPGAFPAGTSPAPPSRSAGPGAASARGSGGFLGVLHSLPKPILFGLYGGLGALLGALLLGEILNLLLPTAKPLNINLPKEPVALNVTTNNDLPIRIVRTGYMGEIKLELVDPPKGVSGVPVTIPKESATEPSKDGKEVTMVLKADASAEVGKHPLKIRASGSDGGSVDFTENFELDVRPALAISLPKDPLLIYHDGFNELEVPIERAGFKGAIKLTLTEPDGKAEAETVTIAPDQEKGKLVVRTKLKEGDHEFKVKISAEAEGDFGKALVDSKSMDVKVGPSRPGVAVTASPSVSTYAGEVSRIPVKIARHRFAELKKKDGGGGPISSRVTVEVKGKLPEVVREVRPIVISPGDEDGQLEVVMNPDAKEGKYDFRLQARPADETADLFSTGECEVALEVLPPYLAIAASSRIEIFQTGKCKFTVKIARSGVPGKVAISYKNLPLGVTFPAVNIDEGRDEIEIEGKADSDATLGKVNVSITAKAAGGLEASVQPDVEVEVKPFTAPNLDIVFALDTTGSMGFAIEGVKNGIERFARDLEAKGLQAQLALISFRDIADDPAEEAMKIIRFGGSVFTKDFAAFRAEVGRLSAGGGGDLPESSYDAVWESARLPFRKDSQRIIILITDDEPKRREHLGGALFPDKIPKTQAETVSALRANGIHQLHTVYPGRFRPWYDPLQKEAKGTFFDIGDVGGGEGFANKLLPELGREIARMTVAGGPSAPRGSTKIELKAAPTPKTEVAPPPGGKADRPRAAGAAADAVVAKADRPTIGAIHASGAIDRADWLIVVILTGLWTAVMAAGIALLLITGQRLYLTKSLPSGGDLFKVVGAGLAAGLLGGALAASLFMLSSGSAVMDFLTRVPAWTIMGGLLGMGIGLFVPNLGWGKGLLGGCIGGLIGALAFIGFTALTGPLLGRWIGALLVGFFIGLMIALAEIAFRRYWLEVAFGAREIRTVTLGTVPVTLGGDERQAAVFVPGAAPRALGFRLEGEKIFCQDFTSGQVFEVNPGQQQMIGSVRVTVRGAGAAAPAGAPVSGMALRFSNGKSLQLADGLPLTVQDLPGLEPQGNDGMVALVSPRPANRAILLLRNRSKQAWRVVDASGARREVGPGLSVELTSPFQIDFGRVQATFTPG